MAVWGLFSAGWRALVPLNYEVCSSWVGLDQWLVKVSWLGELASVFWWVELGLFSLECNEVSRSEFWSVYGFGMALGRLSANEQCCVSVLLKNCDGASGHWSLLAFGWVWFW